MINRTHKISTIVLFFCVFMLFSSTILAQKKDKFVVVIDAGHGGKDSGARGSIVFEKDVVLAIALKVGNYIKQNLKNIKVIYTRSDDTFVELYERANIANKNNADLFVSIHANSSPNPKSYGTETFVMGLHKSASNLKVAQTENAVITLEDDYSEKYEGFNPNSSESYIVFSLVQNAYLHQSLKLATLVEKEFKNKAHRHDRGVKQAGFLVLWRTSMPSILVETGFVSNAKEERYLKSEKGRDYLASAIYRAIRSYFADLEVSNSQELDISSQDKSDSVSKSENNTLNKTKEYNDKVTNNQTNNNSLKNKTQNPESVDNGLYFSVQIVSSSHLIDLTTKPYCVFKNDIYYVKSNNKYKYYVNKTSDYNKIKVVKDSCHEFFNDAFIVAFNKGKRISISKAIKLKN